MVDIKQQFERTTSWIAKHRAVGQPCDNCGQSLSEDETYAITTVQTQLGKVFYITCVYCASRKCDNVRALCNDFLAIQRSGYADPEWPRLASDEAAEHIERHMESQTAPETAIRWARMVQ